MSWLNPRAFRPVSRTVLAICVLASLVALGQAPAQARQHSNASASLPTLKWPGMIGFTSWFPSLDPAQVTDGTSMSMIYRVNTTLLRLLPGAKYTNGIAKLTVSKNKLVYTFTLRKGLKFSNGDPLTATDVVFTLRRMMSHDAASPTAMTSYNIVAGAPDFYAGKSTQLPGVVKVNNLTVRVKTTQVLASFPLTFAIYAGVVLDHKILTGKPATAKDNYLTNTCSGNVGAGPFKFVCLNKNSDLSSFFPTGSTPKVTLVPNPNYYGPKPKVKLTMEAIKDAPTAYLKYQAGELDATPLPSEEIASHQGKKGFLHYPSTLVWYLSPSVDLAPFDNVHCRLALAYAMNTDQINKTVLHGAQSTIHDMVPKGLTGYYAGKDNPSYNPAKARSELSLCPGGIHNQKLVYVAGGDNDLVYGGAIPAQLSVFGIDVKGEGIPATSWLKLATQPQKATNTPLMVSGLGASGPAIVCKTRTSGYLLNSANWSNTKYDGLCAKALTIFDKKKQQKIYEQAQHMALSQASWITVGQVQNFAIVRPNIHGVIGDPYYTVLAPKKYDWSQISVGK